MSSDHLTRLERESIKDFVTQAAREGYLDGRVLDYGCGRMPYRKIVLNRGGKYIPYDDPKYPNSMAEQYYGDWKETDPFDAILCNQVIQYVLDVPEMLVRFQRMLGGGGVLVMTYPTNWPEVQEADLWRFTKAGMEHLLAEAGFEVLMHEHRASIYESGYEWAFGYGVVARA